MRTRAERGLRWLRHHLVLIGVILILLLLFVIVLWYFFWPRTGLEEWVTTIVEPVFLAGALLVAMWYAWSAWEQVNATRLLVSHAYPFITDPVETVKDYARKGRAAAGLGADKYHWLVIEITNEGEGTLMNIWVSANWLPKGYGPLLEVESRGYITAEEDFGTFDGEIKEVWRQWRLRAHDSRLFYFPPPPYPRNHLSNHALRIRWSDPNYDCWENEVRVFYKDDQDTWCTNWDRVTPRRL